MGGSDSKLNFRKAVVQLTTKKTVREIRTMYFHFYAMPFSKFFGQGNSWLPTVCFTWSTQRGKLHVNCLLFSGRRSDRRHFLGSVLVWIGGKYQRRVHSNSCFRNQITTGRKSFKFGDAMLQGGQKYSGLISCHVMNKSWFKIQSKKSIFVNGSFIWFPFYWNIGDCFCRELQ